MFVISSAGRPKNQSSTVAAGYKNDWQREMQEGRDATAVLGTTVRSWVPLVASDIANLDGSEFADSPVPDDVIRSAEHLLAIVAARADAQGNPLPYRALADVRSAAEAFDPILQAVRKTLSIVGGRQDKDFQKLRIQRAAQRDEDDEPGAPVPELPADDEPADS
jgi:hypothetical protein